jgi:CHAT domain-containing protein/Tfp pilus assembly protein PilF
VVFALTLGGSCSLPDPTADPPQSLTTQEEQRLEAQAAQLLQAGKQAYQEADLVTAVAKTRESLQIHEQLYPKDRYPQGHPDLARTLAWMGGLLEEQGSYGEAREYFERSLAMTESLYPKERYPQGHPDLAASLNNLGGLLLAQGSYGEARGYYERALAMDQLLYPKEHYPQSHPSLARSLNNLGRLLRDQGSYSEARRYLERALAMRELLYPKERYPEGHPHLVDSLNNLGGLLLAQGSYGEARGYYERALAMDQLLFPKEHYPQGHPALATSLNNLGKLLLAQGSYSEGRKYLERALAMNESLYPKEHYPQGHPYLAISLQNLGHPLWAQGSYGEARGYLERALAMRELLYPKERYPEGHPELAASLNDLGRLLHDQGSYSEARKFLERALAMTESLYPKDRYPEGHPYLAQSLQNLGLPLQAQGSSGEARGYLERALAMRELLYAKNRYPKGHPELAASLAWMGRLLQDQGSYVDARGYLERALAMTESLYPKEHYTQGHPYLAFSLHDLGFLLQAQGLYEETAVFLRQGTDMQQALAHALVAPSSEAEALTYMSSLPLAQDGLISVSLHLHTGHGETYRRIWNGKSALTQLLHDRQAATLRRAASNPALQKTVEDWREARSRLARLILATADGDEHPERLTMIQQLGGEKERYERELAEAIPEFAWMRALEQSRYDDLLKILPEGTALLDLVRFTRFEQDLQVKGKKGERWTLSYAGFVLAKGQPVQMVDLGPAQPIEYAVSQWRQAISQGQDSLAAANLRKLVWEPLSHHLPKSASTIYLAPDAVLSFIPWVALPGERPGTVLLEQYAVAAIPHAPFLLDRLTAQKSSAHESNNGMFLAVGGVAYGEKPKPIDDDRTRRQLLAARPAETNRGGKSEWPDLPGTLQELDAVSRLGGGHEILRLQAAEVSTARLLQELPHARWAHVATHGFFADPSIRSVLTPDPKLFTQIGRERVGVGLRNPLVLSGLVLAGANRPVSADPLAHDDRGILTAEAIAGLDLSGLDLVVLSACETGLGLVAGGEGVFGLQRAFHMAGAHNVIASLWKVDDQETAALMSLFYDRLWRQGKPPIEALREAQLAIYYHPELVGKLAATRGTPDFDKLVRMPQPAPGHDGPTPRRALVRQWAAFVLSGDGR